MVYIGIDPDIDKSGVAVWNSELKTLNLDCLDFFQLTNFILLNNLDNEKLTVIIEAGHLISKSNWHNEKQGVRLASKIGKNVGENHAVGKLIELFCKKNKINYKLVKPKGKVNKELFKKITGYDKRINQELRDAGMLVFGL